MQTLRHDVVQNFAKLFVGLLLTLLAGCSLWHEEPEPVSELPAIRIPPDSVMIAITTILLPSNRPDIQDAIWNQVDEQNIDADVRQRLAANGFRVGVVGIHVPEELVQRFQQGSSEAGIAKEVDVMQKQRRVSCRHLQRVPIMTGESQEELIVLHNNVTSGRVSGRPLTNAQCCLAARCFVEPNNMIRLQITPEIHHGQMQQHFIPGDGAWQIETGLEREVYDDLQFESALMPGHTLMIGTTTEAAGLGHAFFATSSGSPMQKIMLIRLAQTQNDQLFWNTGQDQD